MKLIGNTGKRVRQPRRFKRKAYYSAVALGALLVVSALSIFIYRLAEEASARDEYDSVREIFLDAARPVDLDTDTDIDIPAGTDDNPVEIEYSDTQEEESTDYGELRRLAMAELLEINSDFIGWISIDGLIEYPVVRGSNNHRYLNTTFTGQRNPAGAIFMDYRHMQGFDETISIVYGHLTGDGTMFSVLHKFRDPAFLRENPYIEITTLDGGVLTYRIFAARVTDVWNPAYTLSFTDTARAISGFPNAPNDAERFMLLSTCTWGDDDYERLLVFAAFEEGAAEMG